MASVGNSERVIINELAKIEAFGEINNIPPPRLQQILDKAREEMTTKPDTPEPPTP